MAVGRDKPPGLYLALSKLYTYLCKVDQSMALHCFSLFADGIHRDAVQDFLSLCNIATQLRLIASIGAAHLVDTE